MKLPHTKLAATLGAALLLATAGGAFAATSLDSNVNVMAGPGSSTKIIGKLKMDDSVSVASQTGSWCKISAPTVGWVPCADINGYTPRTNLAPATPTGYNFNSDPFWGPNGGYHSVYQHHFS